MCLDSFCSTSCKIIVPPHHRANHLAKCEKICNTSKLDNKDPKVNDIVANPANKSLSI